MQTKKTTTEWEKKLQITYVVGKFNSQNVQILRMYRELPKLNNDNKKYTKNGQRICIDISSKEIYKW